MRVARRDGVLLPAVRSCRPNLPPLIRTHYSINAYRKLSGGSELRQRDREKNLPSLISNLDAIFFHSGACDASGSNQVVAPSRVLPRSRRRRTHGRSHHEQQSRCLHRAADRGRDHRHSGGHRDSEVRDDQGQGQAGLGQDGHPELHDGAGSVFLGLGALRRGCRPAGRRLQLHLVERERRRRGVGGCETGYKVTIRTPASRPASSRARGRGQGCRVRQSTASSTARKTRERRASRRRAKEYPSPFVRVSCKRPFCPGTHLPGSCKGRITMIECLVVRGPVIIGILTCMPHLWYMDRCLPSGPTGAPRRRRKPSGGTSAGLPQPARATDTTELVP